MNFYEFKKVGSFRMYAGDAVYVVARIMIYEDSHPLAIIYRDEMRIRESSWPNVENQIVRRVINKTIFTVNNHFFASKLDAEIEKLFDELGIRRDDSMLRSVVSMCEGADGSDVEKFRHATKIDLLEITENGLTAGLGYPGSGGALMKVHFDHRLEPPTKLFLQIVHSYMEGYCVHHHEITRELYMACKRQSVENFFSGRD